MDKQTVVHKTVDYSVLKKESESYEVMKRHERALNAYYQVKDANEKRLHIL